MLFGYVVISAFMIAFAVSIIVVWVRWAAVSKEKARARRIAGNVGFALTIYGFSAFFLQMLAACGLILSMPSDWNLPMGYAGCVHDKARQQFCVSFSGRVQKYNSEAEFVKGWSIDAFGGSAKIRKTKDDVIQLITNRRTTLYTFDGDGNRVSMATKVPREVFERTKNKTQYVTTPLLLMPLTHPFLGIFTAILGVLITRIEDPAFWRSELPRRWVT